MNEKLNSEADALNQIGDQIAAISEIGDQVAAISEIDTLVSTNVHKILGTQANVLKQLSTQANLFNQIGTQAVLKQLSTQANLFNQIGAQTDAFKHLGTDALKNLGAQANLFNQIGAQANAKLLDIQADALKHLGTQADALKQIPISLSSDPSIVPPSVHVSRPHSDVNPAAWMYERLGKYIQGFEAELDNEHEIGARLVSFGQSVVFHIESMGYHGPDIIVFYGTTDAMEKVQLIQHLSQLSVLLIAVKKQQDKPRRIGFLWDKEDSKDKES